MSPMGGKRHKGIGYNKARKKKLLPPEPIADESVSSEESEAGVSTEPAPSLPAIEPLPPAIADSASADAPDALAKMKEHLM